MAEMSWNFSSTDPAEWLDPNIPTDAHPPGGGFNGSFYSNPEVDDLLTKARTTFSQEERASYSSRPRRSCAKIAPGSSCSAPTTSPPPRARLKGIELNSDPSVISF